MNIISGVERSNPWYFIKDIFFAAAISLGVYLFAQWLHAVDPKVQGVATWGMFGTFFFVFKALFFDLFSFNFIGLVKDIGLAALFELPVAFAQHPEGAFIIIVPICIIFFALFIKDLIQFLVVRHQEKTKYDEVYRSMAALNKAYDEMKKS